MKACLKHQECVVVYDGQWLDFSRFECPMCVEIDRLKDIIRTIRKDEECSPEYEASTELIIDGKEEPQPVSILIRRLRRMIEEGVGEEDMRRD